jgi:microfibrillar-associated protein 1
MRRGLSDAEIARLDAEALQPKEKKKWKFLQKYYHKGAFYQDDELVKETGFTLTHTQQLLSQLTPSALCGFAHRHLPVRDRLLRAHAGG